MGGGCNPFAPLASQRCIYVTDRKVGRTASAPNSALCLIVDKDQGLRSGIQS